MICKANPPKSPPTARARKPRPWESAFLAELARKGNWTGASRLVGHDRKGIEAHAQRHPDFRASCDAAIECANDAIRETIRARGIEGWEEPVYQQGRMVGTVIKFSDACLLSLAKARCPEFRDRIDLQVAIAAKLRAMSKELGIDADEILAEANRIAAVSVNRG